MSQTYKIQTENDYELECEELLKELPSFCKDFYDAKINLAKSSQALYMRHMKTFLLYLHDVIAADCWLKPVCSYTYDDMQNLVYKDAEGFVVWLMAQHKYGKNNKDIGKLSRKTIESYLHALSSYWNYFIVAQDFSGNIWSKIEKSSKNTKELIYIVDEEQKTDFMDSVIVGQGLKSDRAMKFHEKTALRDNTICSILLTTGIRVSELVGLDINDLYLERDYCNIVTKGSKEKKAYFPDYVTELVSEYLEYRKKLPLDADNKALFVSTQGRTAGERLSVRAVERLVKKYAEAAKVDNADKITPHKLRSTAAMNVLEKTGNIALVKEFLNHENIGTTQIYAKAREEAKERIRELL